MHQKVFKILAKPSLPRRRRGISPLKGEKKIVILALETSCDETATSVLSVRQKKPWPEIKTLSSIIKSQIKIHKSFGGVVPEAAARAHVKYIRPVVEKALQAISYKLEAVDRIAVTVGPGLLPSLMVGVEFAKALSFAAGIPMIPVNHLLGHLYSPFGRENSKFLPCRQAGEYRNSKQNLKSKILNPKSIFPIVSLIVSGGHTMLVLMKNIKEYKVLGQTIDDAAGEAFDKVAKMLGLPYPGGPIISKLASGGNPRAINFPRPMINHKNYNFSFSGLKTAVLYYLQNLQLTAYSLQLKKDVCASFQQAAVDVLVVKTLRAAKEFGARSISLSGGVAANQRLRKELMVNCQKSGVKFFVPAKNLCADNAEMIGLAAAFMLHNGYKPVNFNKVKADSNLSL